MSRCILPSIGSSPSMKCIAGVGAVLLRWRIPFKIFLWKSDKGAIWWVLRANEDRPDLVIGQVKVLKMCIFTRGLSIHLYAKAGPSILKSEFRPFFNLASMFLSSCLVPVTIWPRCSLFSTTLTVSQHVHVP